MITKATCYLMLQSDNMLHNTQPPFTKAVTRGLPGTLQISNTMGPPVTLFQNDSTILDMKFV